MVDILVLASFVAYFVCIYGFSALSCAVFSYAGTPLFVAKPRDWTPERHHQTKQGIPTMGGLAFLTVWVCFTAFFLWRSYVFYLPALWIVASMGLLGAYDDWSKINRRGGISAGAKFVCQNLSALIAGGMWYWGDPAATGELWIPLFNVYFPIGIFMVLWGAFVMVAASNAVNLTDGLDGLAGTVLLWAFLFIAFLAALSGGLGGLSMPFGESVEGYASPYAVLFGAFTAAAVIRGFLQLNRHPAALFMGDTGALALGALLGLYAVQLNVTLLLPLIAMVPVAETLSVIIQVAWFKRYQKRIFKMAPLHHHFELIGYSELQIVRAARIFTILGGAIACLLFFFKN
jgi:phospho-N-acetylmuramoyl-pentapeptide-transferase